MTPPPPLPLDAAYPPRGARLPPAGPQEGRLPGSENQRCWPCQSLAWSSSFIREIPIE